MHLHYSLDKNDYLQYFLYDAAHNKDLIRKKRKYLIYLAVLLIIIGINSYNNTGFWYFIPVFVLILCLFVFTLRRNYKSHYKKFIEKNYQERINLESDIYFEENMLMIKNRIAESKIYYESLEQINETADYFFLKLKTSESIIIPKVKISNETELKRFLQQLKNQYRLKEHIDLTWTTK